MKASKLGLLSAVIASSCCVTPLLLMLAGLGSVGFATQFSQYHSVFAIVGVALLGLSYRRYFKERKRCAGEGCQMQSQKFTQISLTLSTLMVAFAIGLMVFSHIGVASTDAAGRSVMLTPQSAEIEIVSLKIEGMTCISCAWGVETSLKRVKGVVAAAVDFNAGLATVQYRPTETTPEKLIQAVNESGYRASLVQKSNQPPKTPRK